MARCCKKVDGGANLEAYVYWPVAVNNIPETDLLFVLSAPTFEEWGSFWDAYKHSDVAKLDEENEEFIIAPNSGIWEAIHVKSPSGKSGMSSATMSTQMWKCEIDDNATEEQVEMAAEEWLAAARTMKGGANLQASVLWPVAVNNVAESDLIFVVSAPTFKEWGAFWDGYKDSPAAKLDEKQEDFIVAPNSALWESTKVTTDK